MDPDTAPIESPPAATIPLAAGARRLFLAIVMLQGVHAVEEYIWRIWNDHALTRAFSLLFADDPARGFILFNIPIVALGLWAWAARVRPGARAGRWTTARGWAIFWIVLELINGIGHSAMSLEAGRYVAGQVTALLLFALALLLAREILRSPATKPAR